MQISEDFAHRCNAGIMLSCQLCTVFLGIHTHTAEFVNHKGLTTDCDTLLFVNNRTMVIYFDHNCTDQHKRRSDNDTHQRDHDINRTFEENLFSCQSHIS